MYAYIILFIIYLFVIIIIVAIITFCKYLQKLFCDMVSNFLVWCANFMQDTLSEEEYLALMNCSKL